MRKNNTVNDINSYLDTAKNGGIIREYIKIYFKNSSEVLRKTELAKMIFNRLKMSIEEKQRAVDAVKFYIEIGVLKEINGIEVKLSCTDDYYLREAEKSFFNYQKK